MSDIANVVEGEKVKMKDISIMLVTDIEINEGTEMNIKELDSDIKYNLRAQITRSFKEIYYSINKQELSEIIQKIEDRALRHNVKYYIEEREK